MSRPRRRRALRLLSLTLLLAALLVSFLPSGTSNAEEPITTAWWQRSIPLTGQSGSTAVIARIAASPDQVPPLVPPTTPTVPVTVPPDVTVPPPPQEPPTPDPTPSGGLMVANDPTGPRAIAALRFDVPDAAGGLITLKVANGSTPAPAVRACPTLSDWQAGPNQAWSRRPAHDCGRLAVTGAIAADGTVTFDLPDDFRDPDALFFDVLLVPAEGDGTPYQTIFEKPGADALEVTATLPQDDDDEDDFGDLDFELPTTGFDEFYDEFYDPGLPVIEGSTSDPVYTEPTANRSGDRSGLRRVGSVLENPTARRIAALALILLGGYSYWQSGQTMQRAPRLLGSLGGGSAAVVMAGPGPARPRGIGRFARVRRTPPTKL